MSERYLLLKRIKGRPWKLVQEFSDLDAACMQCEALNAFKPSRPYRVAIQEPDPPSAKQAERTP